MGVHAMLVAAQAAGISVTAWPTDRMAAEAVVTTVAVVAAVAAVSAEAVAARTVAAAMPVAAAAGTTGRTGDARLGAARLGGVPCVGRDGGEGRAEDGGREARMQAGSESRST